MGRTPKPLKVFEDDPGSDPRVDSLVGQTSAIFKELVSLAGYPYTEEVVTALLEAEKPDPNHKATAYFFTPPKKKMPHTASPYKPTPTLFPFVSPRVPRFFEKDEKATTEQEEDIDVEDEKMGVSNADPEEVQGGEEGDEDDEEEGNDDEEEGNDDEEAELEAEEDEGDKVSAAEDVLLAFWDDLVGKKS